MPARPAKLVITIGCSQNLTFCALCIERWLLLISAIELTRSTLYYSIDLNESAYFWKENVYENYITVRGNELGFHSLIGARAPRSDRSLVTRTLHAKFLISLSPERQSHSGKDRLWPAHQSPTFIPRYRSTSYYCKLMNGVSPHTVDEQSSWSPR